MSSEFYPTLNRNVQCGNSLVGYDVTEHLILDAAEEDLLNPFDWVVAFPGVVGNGGFEVVIGNPPYDVLEKARGAASWPHATLRDYLPQRADYAPARGGKLNLYRLFLVQSIRLTRTNGRFGMIVPLSLAADISTASTRKYVLSALREPVLDCFPQKDNSTRRVFRRAKLSTVVVTGARSRNPVPPTNSITTRVFPGNNLTDTPIENVLTIADCTLLDPIALPIPLTDVDEWKLCRRLHAQPSTQRVADLYDSYTVNRGEINQTVYRDYITATTRGTASLLKGVEVGAFEQRTTLSQGRREWIDERRLLADHKQKRVPPSLRIATQRITGVDERQRLVATLIETGAWFADSTNSISSLPDAPLGLDYLVALLNSDLYQWRFRITSTNNNVGTNELLALPVHVPNPTSAKDQLAVVAVRSAGAHVAHIKANQISSQSADAKDRHQRRLIAAMARLNNAVYGLYGLNVAERALVTARLSRMPIVAAAGEEP